MRSYYTAVIEQDRSDGPFGVVFPEFPGCVTVGDTLPEALANAEEALALHIRGMVEDGEAIPAPTDPREHAAADNFVAPIPVTIPGKVVRKNITIDEDLWSEIAARSGNVSAFLTSAAREKLKKSA